MVSGDADVIAGRTSSTAMYLSRRANTSPTASISLAALITPVSSNRASYRDTFERRS